MGTLRGGCQKARLEVSRRGVALDEHVAQKMPPHLRQWCLRSNMENLFLQKKRSQWEAAESAWKEL